MKAAARPAGHMVLPKRPSLECRPLRITALRPVGRAPALHAAYGPSMLPPRNLCYSGALLCPALFRPPTAPLCCSPGARDASMALLLPGACGVSFILQPSVSPCGLADARAMLRAAWGPSVLPRGPLKQQSGQLGLSPPTLSLGAWGTFWAASWLAATDLELAALNRSLGIRGSRA